MAASEQIIFQPYIRGKRGGVASGPAMLCRNAEDAHRRANKAMAGSQVIGCHIVRVMADESVGDYGEPEYLATLGTVPE